ncbi:FkbM family methyltransferase [Formosa maritima]|nr:FkbM family methyltransferase [Formosa maritima]
MRNKIGKSRLLKPLRNLFLKTGGRYKEGDVAIERQYLDYTSRFRFFSSIKNVVKAKKSGIENTLILNSFKILADYKSEKEDLIIFDVGANFGFLSLVWATTLCENKGKIIAFEPNLHVYHTFRKSIEYNHLKDKISLHDFAVGSENKTISLFMNNTTSNVLETQENLDSSDVKMITLDSYAKENQLTHCDLIKIDVDGIELDILEGCRNIIETFAPIFIVETNNDESIVSFFEAYNYLILDMKLKPFDRKMSLPLNIFCIPKN